MRRTIGFLFFYGGLAVIVLAWLFRRPLTIGVGGHYVSGWLAETVLGFVLVLLGVVISGPTRKR